MVRTYAAMTLAGAALIAGSLYGVNEVGAFGFRSSSEPNTFFSQLAQKLGVEETVVETAMDEIRDERHQEVQNSAEERLNAAVASGALTQEQKNLILQKRAELHTEFTAVREQRESHQAELKAWAEENDIDARYLYGFGPGNGQRNEQGRGMGAGRMHK